MIFILSQNFLSQRMTIWLKNAEAKLVRMKSEITDKKVFLRNSCWKSISISWTIWLRTWFFERTWKIDSTTAVIFKGTKGLERGQKTVSRQTNAFSVYKRRKQQILQNIGRRVLHYSLQSFHNNLLGLDLYDARKRFIVYQGLPWLR